MVKIIFILSLPGVIWHELSHILFAYLLGGKCTKIRYEFTDKRCSVIVSTLATSELNNRLIALAPLITMWIPWYLLMGEWWYWIFVAFGTWPSNSDIEHGFNLSRKSVTTE